MTECPAIALILFHGELCRAVCNLPAGHEDHEHEDIILGKWGASNTARQSGE